MILPLGKAAYENLNTSFVDFDGLLEDLTANRFTGYVRVSFWQYDGAIFLDSGSIMNAVEEADGQRSTGSLAVTNIMKRAKEKDGNLGVYALSADVLTTLVGALSGEVLYRNLTTDFSSLEQLIPKLESEGHSGYIEVTVEDGKGEALVFMKSGQVVESVFSAGGDVASGVEVLPHIVETVSSLGATFNVYKTSYDDAFSDTTDVMTARDLPQLLQVWREVLAAIEDVVDGRLGEHSFQRLFKDTLLEKVEVYPFLDPFAGEFEYKGGEVTYSGAALGKLGPALTDCLSRTLDKAAERTSKKKLLKGVAQRLEEVRQERGEAISRFELGDYVAALAAKE